MPRASTRRNCTCTFNVSAALEAHAEGAEAAGHQLDGVLLLDQRHPHRVSTAAAPVRATARRGCRSAVKGDHSHVEPSTAAHACWVSHAWLR